MRLNKRFLTWKRGAYSAPDCFCLTKSCVSYDGSLATDEQSHASNLANAPIHDHVSACRSRNRASTFTGNPVDDAIRIKEFYLVAAQIQDSRLNPKWKDEYFKHLLSMDSFFGN